MAWGALDDPHMAIPPGTVNLINNTSANQSCLKKRDNIVLRPQPSNGPNDPLNWPQSWKLLHFFILAFGSGLTNSVSALVIPGLIPLAKELNVPSEVFSSFAIGAVAFWMAIGGFLTVSGAGIWGRRPFYLLSIALLSFANFLAYISDTFPTLVAMRTITGFASAPLLVLVLATITDIFFVHERGIYIAAHGAVLTGGAQLGQVITGFIIESKGISAVFGYTSLAYAILTVIAYFVVLESAYFRRDSATSNKVAQGVFDEFDEWEQQEPRPETTSESRETYSRRLAIFRGRISESSFWKGALKPLCLIVLPAIAYGSILFSMFLTLVHGIPLLISYIVSTPPYNLQPAEVGLTNLPLLAASLIGGPLNGWVSDSVARFMARRNGTDHGVYEPEFRLVLLFVYGLVTTSGLVGLGISISKDRPLAWLLVWLTAAFLGSLWTTQTVVIYVIDCFPYISGEAFSLMNIAAGIGIFFGSGNLIGWYTAVGPIGVFSVLASLCVFAMMLTLPVYVFGKRLRGRIARVEWTNSLTQQRQGCQSRVD